MVLCGLPLPNQQRSQDEGARGLCFCGCGTPTQLAKRTNSKRGDVKGQPVKYVFGHRRSVAGPMTHCSMPDCDRSHHARGWCQLHHKRWWVHGDPMTVLDPHDEREYERRDESQRFWEKVDKTPSCWLWTGAISGGTGYGSFATMLGRNERKGVGAHRWAYEALVGPIPEGLVLDHLCAVRRCVRPEHLEPVTIGENNRRGSRDRKPWVIP